MDILGKYNRGRLAYAASRRKHVYLGGQYSFTSVAADILDFTYRAGAIDDFLPAYGELGGSKQRRSSASLVTSYEILLCTGSDRAFGAWKHT